MLNTVFNFDVLLVQITLLLSLPEEFCKTLYTFLLPHAIEHIYTGLHFMVQGLNSVEYVRPIKHAKEET